MATLRYSLVVLAVALQSFLLVAAVPTPEAGTTTFQRRAPCTTIRTRKEWRFLNTAERQDYIRAVKCLMTTPAKTNTRRGVVSRFDEFQACHIDLTDQVHQVGHFLAWHRHFITLYDKAMRDECGYKGPATYWDWSRDADSTRQMKDSPVFDVTNGFGGDGVQSGNPGNPGFPGFPGGGGGCVTTGPFNGTMINLGPGNTVNTHCITRAIGETMKTSVTSAAVNVVLSQTTFELFRTTLENGGRGAPGMGIHGGGHGAVGGEMLNPYSSPGDPLFYLHHGNLDRIWWKWQEADLQNRLYALSGPTTQRPPFTNITLDFMMPYTTISSPIAVRDVMDIMSEPSCFQFAD